MGELLRIDDGFYANGIVDDFEEIGLLRGIAVIDNKARRDLSPLGIKHVSRVGTSNTPSPRNHLSPIPVIPKQLNDAFHSRSTCQAGNFLVVEDEGFEPPTLTV